MKILPVRKRLSKPLASVATCASEATEKVPITAFLFIFSVTLFKNYRKRTLKILRSEVFQWPRASRQGNYRFRLANVFDSLFLPSRIFIIKQFFAKSIL